METYITNDGFQASIIGAFGCLMFGYNIGISGGVTLMNDFLVKFFPKVHDNKGGENKYCNYNNQFFQFFTSSLFLATAVSSMMGLVCYKKLGRKRTLWVATLFFIVGVVLQASATNLIMLILGRICLGAGVGFTNQVIPLFISAKNYNTEGLHLFQKQVLITVGILIANLVNLYTYKLQPYGWRISLGGSAIPTLFVAIASIFIAHNDDVGVLQKEASYQEIVNLFMKRRSSWPHLFCGTMIHVFKQFAGINVIVFYFPLIFETIIGLSGDVSLFQTVTMGVIIVFSAVFGAFLFVYKFEERDRRLLFLQGGLGMLMSQLGIGGILAQHTNLVISKLQLSVALQYLYIFVSAFSWSWGTLGWLITSKTFQAVNDDTTCSAMSLIAVITNFLCEAVVAQTSLTMWCYMKGWILFFFFSAWIALIVVMTVFAYNFLPEIRRITKLDDEINRRVWREHWYWKRFYDQGYNEEQQKGFKKKRKKKAKKLD